MQRSFRSVVVASVLAPASLAMAQEAASPPPATPALPTNRDAERGFRLDFSVDAWFPRLTGDVTMAGVKTDVSDLDLNGSEVVFSGAARVTWDRCFVNVSGFSFDTDGNTPGFRTSASWWDVSVDVGYALWRPFNDQPTPWSGVRHWEGNEAKDGGYRFELAIAPTLGFSWDDASVSVDSVGAGPSTSIDGGWAAIRFGGEFVATLHTKDVVGFLQSIDIYADFSAGPSFGVSGDADGTGLYVMLEAGGRIFFTPNIAAHLGYRLTDGDFDVSSGDQANIGLQGLFAGATIRF